ncbi:MAG: LysR family transcriptional regulator, partial [Lachnospiraceae bacterium]|nr:LysR family transcriptional regulator [Lachnospiraceae bacterium]
MTITQIKYFITAAKCLNFTKAADKLFITQPALSRQIASIEMELNMQLFIRNNRSVKLTPAAVVLLDEFEKIYNDYNLAVAKAQSSFAGLSGELNIGILEGAYVGDLFPGVLQHFAQYYPQVKINLRNYSFNMLIDWFGAECDTDMYRLWHPGAHLHSEWAEFEPYHKKGNVIGSTHLSKEIVGGQPTEATLKYLDAHEIYGEKLDEAKVRGDVDVILYACCALG